MNVAGHPQIPTPATIRLPITEPGALAREDMRASTPAAPRAPEPIIRQAKQSCGADDGGSGIVVIYRIGLDSVVINNCVSRR